MEITPLSELLKELRAEAGLSQEQLAKKAGIRKSVIAEVETGRTRHPSIFRLEALADALELEDHRRDRFLAAARAAGMRLMRPGGDERLTELEERVARLEALLEGALRRGRQ